MTATVSQHGPLTSLLGSLPLVFESVRDRVA
jgi:hypothetical protein